MSAATRLALAVALALTATAAAQTPRRFALLVGVEKYDGTEFTSLRFAGRDISELANVLREARYDEVVLLTDDEAFARKNEALFPTADNVRRQLDALLKLVGPGDTLVVAFAGHGVQLQNPAGMFFCPKKADLADPKTLVALDDVYAALKAKKDGFRLLLVDACRNDPLTSRSKTVDNLKSVTRPALPKPPAGVAAIYSCSAGERAFEDEQSRHGFFFRHVLDGLRGGAADANGDVKVPALAQYVEDKVALGVRQRFQNPNIVQKPEAFFEGQSPVLVRAAPAAEIENSAGMTLVKIPAGEGVVGSPPAEARRGPDEPRQRPLRVAAAFYLSRTPVTQKQYRDVTGQSPSCHSATGDKRDAVAGLDTGDFPVEQVSWGEAKKFCDALSQREKRRYRLPTADEWEYAARAGTATAYPWGDDPKRLGEFGWYLGNSDDRTQPVGKKAPNDWKLFDMHGHVWQWTADAVGSQRVAKGGAWDAPAPACRSANARGFPPGTRASNVGFRVLLELGDRR